MTEMQINQNPDSVSVPLSLEEQRWPPARHTGQNNLATEGGRSSDLCFFPIFPWRRRLVHAPGPGIRGTGPASFLSSFSPGSLGKTQDPEARDEKERNKGRM